MKKEIKFQIWLADKFITENNWAGVAFCWYGWTSRPISRNAWRRSDKRAIIAEAKKTAKAFSKNPDGTYRRCGKVREDARLRLAIVIYERADACMCAMLKVKRDK